MSELLDKQVNAQKEKNFRGSRKPMKKCVMKMKQRIRKQRMRKNIVDGRRAFIGQV